MSLAGKVAAVTGASRGIGREIALRLAASGASVACIATTEASAGKVVAEIKAAGGQAAAFGCDVGDPGQVEQTFEAIAQSLGTIEILVNNAGIARDALMLRMKDGDWDKVLETNLKGAYLCSKAVLKGMMKARWGRIVNMTSIVGQGGAAGQANYAAAKAGLIGLTKALAKEVGSRGITCNAVAPGFIETDMTADLPEEMRQYVVQRAPLGRLGSPADVAEAVLFLASEGAGYITGQTLTVDGGLTL